MQRVASEEQWNILGIPFLTIQNISKMLIGVFPYKVTEVNNLPQHDYALVGFRSQVFMDSMLSYSGFLRWVGFLMNGSFASQKSWQS